MISVRKKSMETSWSRLIFLLVMLINQANTFDIKMCDDPLGMESGAIPDDAISASSSYVPNVGPRNGRLKVERAGGGWCPKQQVERGVREYLQIDLGRVHVVTGVQTQGRYDNGRGQEYAEEYTLEYWRPGMEEFKQYTRWDGKTILSGNSDTATVVHHRLMPPVFASKVRILPYSVHRRTVCLRVEINGCPDEGGVVSYTAPISSEPDMGLDDTSYDGKEVDGVLKEGLGRLTDGEFGADNFRLDTGYGKGNGWVAWKNDSLPEGYVELLFEFDQIRNFSAVHFFSNNFFTRDVQVFAKAKLMFSVGGQFYNGRALSYSYMPDRILENARNVTIHLQHKLAKYIKVRLYFANKWIMLSEVLFESVPVASNMTEDMDLNSGIEEIVLSSEGDLAWEPLETSKTIAARKDGQGFVEVIIGVLTAVMLLLLIVFVVILILSKRQKLQGSPTLLRNPFGVTINMKVGKNQDLLMNLSSSNNPAPQSNHPTPISQEPPSDPSSVSLEQYRLPLVNNYYQPNYASVHGGSVAEEIGNEVEVEPPNIPPLPPSPISPSPVPVQSNTLHYRSLQTTPVISPKTKMINLGSYFPSVATDPPNRKRYHTAPRDKQRVPPPVCCWNIAPSMSHSYNCRETELIPIPRYSLRMLESVGTCHAGEINLCETESLEDIIPGVGRIVAVRVVNTERANTEAVTGSMDSLREVRFLAGLSDPNVCRVLGVCTAEQPPWTVIEYGEMGDLVQYLQFLTNKSGTTRNSAAFPLSYSCLIYMAMQIASGMKYLESKHVVHKDLAARNCLVGRGYVVKVADFAVCKPIYRKDYAEIGGRPPAPIRWLPWESILLDRYTCSSSVWAFAVTLWELLSFACEKPYQHLNNDQVIQNAEHMYYGGELQVLLPKPEMCPPEVYSVMTECWKRDDDLRPTFKQIYLFLSHINKDYTPKD